MAGGQLHSKVDFSEWSRDSLLRADKRRGPVAHPPILAPETAGPDEEFSATIQGTQIVVTDPESSSRIFTKGNFGTFVGQRMNFANLDCFLPGGNSTGADSKKMEELRCEAAQWIGKTTGGGGQLHLSPEEALYLAHDINVIKVLGQKYLTPSQLFTNFCTAYGNCFVDRYIVYRYFRQLDWVVRDGIAFGVDFLLYKHGMEYFHSSAGVRVLSSSAVPVMTDPTMDALQRELANCKKKLLLANVGGIPQTQPNKSLCLEDLKLATIQIISVTAWNSNRNRIFDLETTDEVKHLD